eukprot:TRINITY_DN4282_c0_g2_i1.p1 TRINITY_DN4282_c0_g2~~TRINITY_DN4282_c0_g2_i1.p1  ORF type:complete len:882 (-),score=310.20 TRINITY_DN4282_c0_g2_i1:41-2686(-)
MVESKMFYERLEAVSRVHWKDVESYRIFFPEIARGNASLVCLAEENGKKVAIKSYSSQWIFNNQGVLENEIDHYIKLGNVGIAPSLVRKSFCTRNNIYLVMDFCNGGSLDMYVRRAKSFPPAVLREVAKFLAASLLKLSKMKILHREINPQHILVSIDEKNAITYKLIGLQYCKNITPSSKVSSLVGTPEYAAPEAVLETPYSYEADIWSLGITLYELALGAASLKVDPNLRVRIKNGHHPIFPGEKAVPHSLRDLINKCLVYDPKKRLTASDILKHPFITTSEVTIPPPVKPKEEKKLPEPKKEAKKILELDDDRLMEMISEDFAKYIEYVNSIEGHALKAEKRKTLDPYVTKSDKPSKQGGFSDIYFCTDRITGKEYALKIVKTSKMTDVKIAYLLLGEVRIMLELNASPFAIMIRDYFVYRNDLCLVLEYCNGGDLDNYVRRMRRKKQELSVAELKLIAWNIACGLHEMHKRNMMHRDIKPKNILVVNDPITGALTNIKLCDYGLSKKVLDYQELHGSTILGTFDYFAPELYLMMERRLGGEAADTKYDSKIDVWSYGVLLYFTLYGKTPMEPPGSKLAVMKRKKILYPEVKSIPVSYINLIKRALTFEADKRPSFAELLNDDFLSVVAMPEGDGSYAKGKALGERVFECKKDQARAMKVGRGKEVLREIDSLSKLKNSENVVELVDYFSVGKMGHIILELYDSDLEKFIIGRKTPLSKKEQIRIAHLVLNGLKETHTHNIIHGNLHPGNILLKLNNEEVITAVLCDYKYSKILAAKAAPNKPSVYRSPEQSFTDAGGTYDFRSDVWSYGMVVYFLLMGAHADAGGENGNVEEVVGKSGERAKECAELYEIVKECVKTKAEERPSALELLKRDVFSKD